MGNSRDVLDKLGEGWTAKPPSRVPLQGEEMGQEELSIFWSLALEVWEGGH